MASEELASDRDHIREARYLTLRREGEMVRVNGWFDIESGERLLAGLEPGPAPAGDTRSTPARRADHLLEMLEGSSDRPSMVVHVSAETLPDDLHCVFPACDRPERWCDVHHIIPWLAGGPTAIDNLVLLCRHHHTLVHQAG